MASKRKQNELLVGTHTGQCESSRRINLFSVSEFGQSGGRQYCAVLGATVLCSAGGRQYCAALGAGSIVQC